MSDTRSKEKQQHECLQGQPGDVCSHDFCRPVEYTVSGNPSPDTAKAIHRMVILARQSFLRGVGLREGSNGSQP